MACRKAAGDLEMQLHEVESRCRLDMAKMRTAALGEAETLAAKVEAMDGQVARLQSVEAALQRGVLELLESRRHLEHRSAPKQDLQRAGEEMERLQAMIDGLGERLRAKEDEMIKLRETMQVG
jgi:chromosome segregation ATPase